MSRYRRSLAEGATHFFIVNTYHRKALLTHPQIRTALHEAIERVREQLPFKIDAWVLLPDHLHAIWTLPAGDAAYGKRWGMIKSQVSRRCAHIVEPSRAESRIKRHEIDFWQRRFWEHQIRNDLDYERHVDYVHFNPVKHGLVTQVSQWPYSTFHRHVNNGVYPRVWGVDPGEVVGDAGE
jgi:putative transposase